MPEPQRSCLDLTEDQFHSLAQHLAVDGRSLSRDLPQRRIALPELRVILLKRRLSDQAKDAAWAHLVRMAGTNPNPWIMAAAGMMLPGLKSIAARMRPHYPHDPCDLDSEILEAFLHELKRVDPTQPAPHVRLYRAALRWGHQACQREARQPVSQAELPEMPTHPCTGNPDLALARAVRDGAVTARQADLVSRVHLDSARRVEAARSLGISRDRARRELASATRRLSAYFVAA